MLESIIKSALFGVAVGDSIGVPYEFSREEDLKENPVFDMVGYGTYNLPPGKWSDDSSHTFCLAESLCSGFNTDHMGELFVKCNMADNKTTENKCEPVTRTWSQAV